MEYLGIKKEIKSIVGFAFIFFATLLFVMLDNSFFQKVSFLKHMNLSLLICICLSFRLHNEKSIVFSGLIGLFFDLYTFCLPFYSLLYLYTSLACAWCEGLFLKLNLRTVFFMSFLILFFYKILSGLFFFFSVKESVFTFYFLCSSAIFALLNATLSPLIYSVLKRVSF